MKFLCPNCKAKYRIGPEKMVGRQAAKIRCRKCDYLIQIAYRNDSDEFDVTATPPSAPPPAAGGSRPAKPSIGQPAAGPASVRPRVTAPLEEGIGSKKPTAAVPGLPGLGSAKSTRGAALVSEGGSASRRPLAPLPPPPTGAGGGSAGFGASSTASSAGSIGTVPPGTSPLSAPPTSVAPLSVNPLSAPPAPAANGAGSSGSASASSRSTAGSTQLGDQFRESVQAGAVEDLPREGWFVGVNGVPLGPIPIGDLRELAIAGHIDRRSLVWREGQPEWRPLGKYPGLARVIDDGSGPPPTPQPEAAPLVSSGPPPVPPSVPPAAFAGASAPPHANGGLNGANGMHLASGFDVVRPDLSERPSAWGDLDDEDDDDEQPTTVKGRVSVMPSTTGLAAMVPSSAPQPLPPPAPPPVAPALRGNTTSVPVFAPPPPPVSLPAPAAMPGASLSASFGTLSDLDANAAPRASSRTRWYLIAAAIVLAFALGAVVTHLMRSSTAEKPGSSIGVERRSLVMNPFVPEGTAHAEEPARVQNDEATASAHPSRSPPASSTTRTRAHAPAASSSFDTTPQSPSTPPPRAALVSVGGKTGGVAARVGWGPGLDADTVERTARRYSPAVRQSCWRRALGGRAPGVPSSAKVMASITVEPTGRVEAVSVSGAPRGYPGLGRCIEGLVLGWRFPRAAARTITSVPFMFVGK